MNMQKARRHESYSSLIDRVFNASAPLVGEMATTKVL